ncbi:MAG: hypothetical protein R2764_03180 [Bacteroidales bacterium]
MKRILSITIWVVVIAGILVLLGFIEAEHKKTSCKGLEVIIDYQNGDPMITKSDIERQINTILDTVVGKRLSDIETKTIENKLNETALIADADVFTTLTGTLKVKVIQRKPILRIVNSSNQNFYIDETGAAMPSVNGYPSRVLVASGNILEKYSDTLTIHANLPNSTLAKLHTISRYIYQHDFLKSQIEQIYVTQDGEFELVPKVGRQLIIFGDIEDMEKKFDKLIVFYS